MGAKSGAGIEPRNARAAGPQPFRERALGNEFQFQLARQNLPFELLILAHVGSEHALDLTGLEQETHAKVIHASVVTNNGQILHPAVPQCSDEVFRNAA